MSLPPHLPAVVVELILSRLAVLFLGTVGNNAVAARAAALELLAAYHPETADELRLAANIVMLGLQGIEALSQAAAADVPLPQVVRLRSGGMGLMREAAKAERRLAQVQKARLTEQKAEPVRVEAKQEPLAAPHPVRAPHPVPSAPIAASPAARERGPAAIDPRLLEENILASIKRARGLMSAQGSAVGPNASAIAEQRGAAG